VIEIRSAEAAAVPVAGAGPLARIRALGFAGLLVQGGHGGPHHLAVATAEKPATHER